MKSYNFILFIVLALFFSFQEILASDEEANPAECVKMCNQATMYLQNAFSKSQADGEAALEYMGKKEDNRFVWKNSYVFVICFECDPVTARAHPIKPSLVGTDQSAMKDKKGKLFFLEFCQIAKTTGSGWVEYYWPRVGEAAPSRKVTYINRVPGTKYAVGAGVYNTKLSSEQLEYLLKNYD